MAVLCCVCPEAGELPFRDHLQDALESVRGIRGNWVGFRHAHEPGDVLLLDVLHQEQLYGLPLTRTQVYSGGIQVLDVMQRVGDAIGAVNGVYVLALVERPESFEVLEERPQHTNRQRQVPTGALLRLLRSCPCSRGDGITIKYEPRGSTFNCQQTLG
jgi:hypothetical protein